MEDFIHIHVIEISLSSNTMTSLWRLARLTTDMIPRFGNFVNTETFLLFRYAFVSHKNHVCMIGKSPGPFVHMVTMKRASRLLPSTLPKPPVRPCQLPITATFRSRPALHPSLDFQRSVYRQFSSGVISRKADYESQAKELNKQGLDKQEESFHNQIDNAIGEAKELQARTPWHREGSDKPPVKRQRRAGAMTKGITDYIQHHHTSNNLQANSSQPLRASSN